MSTNDLYIALGVPAGQYFMPDGTMACQVFYGADVWDMSPDEYAAWNTVRLTPCAVDNVSPLVQSLAQDGAFYRYDPKTPDLDFMRRHRIAPMGRPIGPMPDDLSHYLILRTNAKEQVTCDIERAYIWLTWWQESPLSVTGAFAVDAVWQAIPWAVSRNLGYLVPSKGAL